MKMIFDFHTHIGKGDPFYHTSNEEGKLRVSPVKLVDEMRKFDIIGSTVIPNFHLPHKLVDANIRMASLIQDFRDTLFPFAWLDPRIDGVCDQLEKLVKNKNFRGLKLHPVLNGYYLTNETVNPLIEKCIKLQIPILIHTGWSLLGSVTLVDKLAKRYPEAKIVIAHMIEQNCTDVVKNNENVYLETSYSQHPRRIEQAVKRLGANKILYGSDYPMGGGMEFEISKIKLAKIKKEEKDMILFKNAIELLKIK
jgi:predicted TIM-barrel fold metal-dependent hydrolase